MTTVKRQILGMPHIFCCVSVYHVIERCTRSVTHTKRSDRQIRMKVVLAKEKSLCGPKNVTRQKKEMGFRSDFTRKDTLLAFVIALTLHLAYHNRLGKSLFFAATFVFVFLVFKNVLL